LIVLSSVMLMLILSYLRSNKLLRTQLLLLFLSLIMFSAFLFEHALTGVLILNSDELVYTFDRGELFDFEGKSSRLIWYFLNDSVYAYSGEYGIESKLLPISSLLFLNYILHVSFPTIDKISYAIFLTPYLIFISIMDLRDVLIISLCFSAFYCFIQRKFMFFLVACLLLIFLRPFVIPLIIIPIMIVSLFDSRVGFSSRFFTILLIGVIFSSLLFLFFEKANSYIYRFSFLIDGGLNESLQGEQLSLNPSSVVKYFGKFLFAPLPTSLLERVIVDGGHEVFGAVDDMVRAIGQFLYYILFAYLVCNLKVLFVLSKREIFPPNEIKLLQIFITFSLAWVCIYTLFSLGDAHTRIKLVHMICVTICSLFIYTYKRKVS